MQGKKRRWTAEERLLIALIRAEPLGDLLPSCRFQDVCELAVHHRLSALLASEIARQGIRTGGSLHWAAATLLSSERDAAIYHESLQRIRILFSQKGIPTIVLKGRSLCHGKPRDIGDIDLLVRETALLEAIETIEAAGYVYVGYLRNRKIKPSEHRNWRELMKWSNQFEFRDPETGALIELHTTFFEKSRVYIEDLSAVNAMMGAIIDSCRPDPGTGCLFLSPEDRVLLLVLHAGIKRAPYRRNFILRHVNDLDRLLDEGFDWDALRERAERCRVLHHLYFLLSVYRLFLDGKIPASVYGSLESALRPGERWLVGLHLDCFLDLHRESYGAAFLYRFFLPFIFPSRSVERWKSLLVIPVLVPESLRLTEIYGLPRMAKSRFLLYLLEPFRWCMILSWKIKAEIRRRPR